MIKYDQIYVPLMVDILVTIGSAVLGSIVGALVTGYISKKNLEKQIQKEIKLFKEREKTLRKLIENQEKQLEVLAASMGISSGARQTPNDAKKLELKERELQLREERLRWKQLNDAAKGLWKLMG